MKSQVRIECPNCPPGKLPALSIDRKRRLYHCFRCGISGKLDGGFGGQELLFEPGDVTLPVTFPESYRPIQDHHNMGIQGRIAWKYLRKRGVTPWQIARYRIGFCSKGLYHDRIIIPIFRTLYSDDLVFFVARSVNPLEPRKYLNPPTPKAGTVFKTFMGCAPHAVIVEGIFDALRVEHLCPSIALLTKKTTPEQLETIRSSCQSATLLLDADAVKDSIPLADEIGHYIPLKRARLETGDPGDTPLQKLRQVLRGGYIYDDTCEVQGL